MSYLAMTRGLKHQTDADLLAMLEETSGDITERARTVLTGAADNGQGPVTRESAETSLETARLVAKGAERAVELLYNPDSILRPAREQRES